MFPGWMGFQTMNPMMQDQMQMMMQQGGMGRGMSAMPGLQMPGAGMSMSSGMPSRLPDLAASEILSGGKTDEEKQRAVVVKALKEIADTEKTREKEKPKNDDSKKGEDNKTEEKKVVRCFLHQKPNKNCKKCQDALRAAEAVEIPKEERPKEALDADEIMRRNNGKSSDGSSDRKNVQISPMLKEQIVKSSYFKSLMDITNVDGLITEIVEYVDSLHVYNTGAKTTPTCFICHVMRLSVLAQIDNELGMLIDNRDYAVVRCVGFLYIRFVTPASELWESLEEYLLDDMELSYSADGNDNRSTIGEYVESLLTQDKYFDSPLPRLPVKVRQMIEEKIAPMLQHRKRMQANRKAITHENVTDTPVEVCMDGTWLRGTAKELASNYPSRVKVKVRLEGGVDVKVHLGKVVIRDSDDSDQDDGGRRRRKSRSRSRGRRGGSPDWSRKKGKSDAEMLQELRERQRAGAVCGQGKVYAKRPLNFDATVSATALAAHPPVHYEADGKTNPWQRKRRTNEDEQVAEELARRKRQDEDERQRKLAGVYKKYCTTATTSSGSCYQDVEKPDVLRLG